MTETIAPDVARPPLPAQLPVGRRADRTQLDRLLARPLAPVALAAGFAAVIGLAIWYSVDPANGLDFGIYRGGGSAVLHGGGLYDPSFAAVHGLNFTYPPFAAVLFTPLALLPQTVALALWTVASILATGVLVAVSLVAVRRAALPRRLLPGVIVAGGLSASFLSPVRNCLGLGQIGVFLVLACIGDVALLKTRWPRGMLVGLATALKMTPGLFIVYFALVRDWKAFRTSVATAIVCWGLTAVALPRDSWMYFARGTGFHALRVGLPNDHLNESLSGLWYRLGETDPRLWWLVSASVLLVVGLWRAARAVRYGNVLAAGVIVGLLSDLVAPISWLHHAIWVVPALMLLMTGSNGYRRLLSLGGTLVALEILLMPMGLVAGTHFFSDGPFVELYVALFVALVVFLPVRPAAQQQLSEAKDM